MPLPLSSPEGWKRMETLSGSNKSSLLTASPWSKSMDQFIGDSALCILASASPCVCQVVCAEDLTIAFNVWVADYVKDQNAQIEGSVYAWQANIVKFSTLLYLFESAGLDSHIEERQNPYHLSHSRPFHMCVTQLITARFDTQCLHLGICGRLPPPRILNYIRRQAVHRRRVIVSGEGSPSLLKLTQSCFLWHRALLSQDDHFQGHLQRWVWSSGSPRQASCMIVYSLSRLVALLRFLVKYTNSKFYEKDLVAEVFCLELRSSAWRC